MAFAESERTVGNTENNPTRTGARSPCFSSNDFSSNDHTPRSKGPKTLLKHYYYKLMHEYRSSIAC